MIRAQGDTHLHREYNLAMKKKISATDRGDYSISITLLW